MKKFIENPYDTMNVCRNCSEFEVCEEMIEKCKDYYDQKMLEDAWEEGYNSSRESVGWNTGFPENDRELYLIYTKDKESIITEYNENCQVFVSINDYNHLFSVDYVRRWKKLRIIYLPLKKEWYDMIESGVKKEEYRLIKPYWVDRLCEFRDFDAEKTYYTNDIEGEELVNYIKNFAIIKDFDIVMFSYGYTKKTMAFWIDNIEIGVGKEEWGAVKDFEYFTIKLGERIK